MYNWLMFFTGLNQGIYNFYKNIFPLRKERMIQLELEKKTICSKQFNHSRHLGS